MEWDGTALVARALFIMTYSEPDPSDVQDILDSTLDTTSLQAHIDASAYDIQDIEAADSSIADSRLTDMHKYYAAYFATGQAPRASSRSGANRSVNYADENADYLGLATRLDPTGILERSAKPKATLSVPDTKGIYDGS